MATVSQIAAPQRRRGLLRSPWGTPLLDLPGAHESGDSFAHRSPPRDGEASSDPLRTSLCWTSQEPTKVATVSQIAAPQGRRRLLGSPSDVAMLDLPGANESGDSFADRIPPGMARSNNLNLRRVPTMLAPEQLSKVATVSQIAPPQGWRGLT